MSQAYNNPVGGAESSIGEQINTKFYDRKALFETRRDRYFSSLAEVVSMPKHMGKKIEKFHLMPLLDERNTSDQGIDASGAVLVAGEWGAWNAAGVQQPVVATGELQTYHATEALAWVAAGAGGMVKANAGNLYGGSKDIGLMAAKLPVIGENGGRVNRVGFTRLKLEGTMENYGIFTEITDDLLNFDTMSDLYESLSRELITGGVQMTEAMIQIDLLNSVGVTRYGGIATSKATMTGEGTDISVVDYDDFQRLDITLDNNRSPKTMKMIKGSTMTDTVTVANGRLLYCGSEMIPTLTRMTDHFGTPAFVSVEHYGYAGTYKEGTNMLHGEIGKISGFRIIVVPEMAHDAGAGADVTDVAATAYRYSGNTGAEKYDVFPMLTVGADSFTTIGFQTGGGADFKFKIRTAMPGEILNLSDPYAKTGFSSLQFWYGFMPLRTERIAALWSIAER